MRPTVEALRPVQVKEKELGITNLHNMLVMASPNPRGLPSPARMDREFKLLAARAKKPAIQELVSDSIGSAIAATAGSERIEFVHQIHGATQSLINLREGVTTKDRRQNPQTLDAIIDTLAYLQARGQQDVHAVDMAKQLLFTYAETHIAYNPTPVKRESLETSMSKNDTAIKKLPIYDGVSSSVVRDRAGVHEKGALIYKGRANKPDVSYMQRFDRDGATATVEVLVEDGKQLEYALSLLVKEEGGEWRKVRLAPPVPEEQFDSSIHVPAQGKHTWTADLPTGEAGTTNYAIVAEATPWMGETNIVPIAGTVYAEFNGQEEEKSANTKELITKLRSLNINFAALFDTNGVHGSELNLRKYGAMQLLDYLRKTGNTDILELPIMSVFNGKENYTQLDLRFTARAGFAGNTDTVPLRVLMEKGEGSELTASFRKGDKSLDGAGEQGKPRDLDIDEVLEKEAIWEALGGEMLGDRSEVIIYNQVETSHEVEKRLYGSVTDATSQTAPLELQSLAPHEAGDGESNQQMLVQVVPFIGRTHKKRIVRRHVDINTIGDLLTFVSHDKDFNSVRIQSEDLVVAYHEDIRRQEEARREAAARSAIKFERIKQETGAWSGSSTDLSFDRYAVRGGPVGAIKSLVPAGDNTRYTDVTSTAGEKENRGTSSISSAVIIGELPMVEVAMATTIPTQAPPRVRDSARKLSLV